MGEQVGQHPVVVQVQGQGLAITNFLFCMVWTFAYPAYIKFPGQEMPDFYPVFTLFNAWMGLVIFIFLGLSSKRFRFVLSRWRKQCGVSVIICSRAEPQIKICFKFSAKEKEEG